MQENHSLVSVVIPNYNGAHLLLDCLPSLKRQLYPSIEVIVVDSGSIDNSKEVAESFNAEFIGRKKHSVSRGRNVGAKAARGKYVFFMDNDVRLDEKAVQELVIVMERENEAFAAECRQYNWEGTQIVGGGSFFRKTNWLGSPYFPLIEDYDDNQSEVVEEVWGGSCALMVRRKQFLEMGGCDERIWFGFEDLDLCMRARMRGWKIFFVPNAVAYHKLSSTRHGTARIFSSERGFQRFIIKNFSLKRIIQMVLVKKTIQFFSCLFTRRVFESAAIISGMVWNLVLLPDTLKERKKIYAAKVIDSERILNTFLLD